MKRDALVGIVPGLAGQHHTGRQQMVDAESGIDRIQAQHRPRHQSTTREENQRQRNLDDHQRHAACACGETVAVWLARVRRCVPRRRLERREGAEEEPAERGRRQRKQQRHSIERDVFDARRTLWRERDDGLDKPHGNADPEQSAER